MMYKSAASYWHSYWMGMKLRWRHRNCCLTCDNISFFIERELMEDNKIMED